jgi:hypothetical protein
MSEPLKIRLEAGDETEDLAKSILRGMPDEELDEVGVERVYDRSARTANEPITIGVVLTIAIGAEATVCGIKAIQSIAEAVKAYIELRTKKLEAEKAPAPVPENLQIVVLSGELPNEIRSIRGNRYLQVAIDRSRP